MKKEFSFLILMLFFQAFFSGQVFAINFFDEELKMIDGKPKSIYLESGVFYKAGQSSGTQVKAVRHAYQKQKKTERIVIDLSTSSTPSIYAYLAKAEKKIYIDIFNATVARDVSSRGNSKLVKNLLFYPVNKEVLTLEIEFSQNIGMDLFYLENPGRIVLDTRAIN